MSRCDIASSRNSLHSGSVVTSVTITRSRPNTAAPHDPAVGLTDTPSIAALNEAATLGADATRRRVPDSSSVSTVHFASGASRSTNRTMASRIAWSGRPPAIASSTVRWPRSITSARFRREMSRPTARTTPSS